MSPEQERKLDLTFEEIRKVKFALIGSDENGNDGIVKKVFEHEKVLKEINDLKNQGKGIMWVFGVFWLLATFGIPLLIGFIFNKH